MIVAKNILKKFNNKIILNNLNFEITPNSIWFIIGASGVGKSVLAKTITGLIPLDSGSILIDNNKVIYQKLNRDISYLFQDGNLIDFLTVEENISLIFRKLNKKMGKDEIDKEVNKLLEGFNITKYRDNYPKDISLGVLKKGGIARILAANPKYIIFDEPTTGMDPIDRDNFIQFFKNFLKNSEITPIIISHNRLVIKELSENIIYLDRNGIKLGNYNHFKSSKDKQISSFFY